MDFRKLRHLVTVIEQGSLGRAATHLRVSQPALTKSLRSLERHVGSPLLERSPVGVAPTVFGRSLFIHAKAILADAEHAQEEIARLRGEELGYIRFGTLPSLVTGLVSTAVHTVLQRRPEFNIRVVEKQNHELLQALQRGEFDFALGLAEDWEPESGITQRFLTHDRLALVVRGKHPLSQRSEIARCDLLEFPWMVPVIGMTHRPTLRNLFREAGLSPPQARIESGSVPLAKRLIRDSDLIGMLPRHAVHDEVQDGTLCCLPIESEALNRSIMVYQRNRHQPTAPVRAVLLELERVCRNWAAGPIGNGRTTS